MDKNGKINILCIPSDRFGVGFWRSVSPHRALALKMPEKFNVDIMYEIPQQGILEEFYKTRTVYYNKRKKLLIDTLQSELDIISSKIKFINYKKCIQDWSLCTLEHHLAHSEVFCR